MGTIIFVAALLVLFPIVVLMLGLAATRRRARFDWVVPRWSPFQASSPGTRSIRGGALGGARMAGTKSRPMVTSEGEQRLGGFNS